MAHCCNHSAHLEWSRPCSISPELGGSHRRYVRVDVDRNDSASNSGQQRFFRGLSVRCRSSGNSNASSSSTSSLPPSKIVTFIGKGGVGKTFSAVLAAQYYASLGLRTALAVQSQDPTADFLLNGKLGTYAAPLTAGNLSAFRLDATKLLLEPWSQLKEADAEMNFSQGALDEVASEELSILPGMDSILAIGLLEKLSGIAGESIRSRKQSPRKYDMIVYDGPSSEETLRMFGAAERARWYMRRLRSIADKTDAGRVAVPSILRAVGTAVLKEPAEKSTAEIWTALDSVLSNVAAVFADQKRFGCFLVTNPSHELANASALRYWGCALQAGVRVAGALHIGSGEKSSSVSSSVLEEFSPLSLADLPRVDFSTSPDWTKVLQELRPEASQVLQDKLTAKDIPPAMSIDESARTVTLFIPGFLKSEIKLSQWRGNTELLVDAGDQRRSFKLGPELQGKVVGAKFQNRSLVVTIGKS